jgi:hypothetical protein
MAALPQLQQKCIFAAMLCETKIVRSAIKSKPNKKKVK